MSVIGGALSPRVALPRFGAALVGAALFGATLLLPTRAGAQSAPASDPVEKSFAAFWAADGPAAAERAADMIVASGVSFQDALTRLKQGRTYSASAKRGRVNLTHMIDRVPHPYTVIVPDSYDPSRPMAVRVQLHGGVGRPLQGDGQAAAAAGRLPGTKDEIYVLPNAWDRSMWWMPTQADNIPAILDRLKRTYNVDENRVYLTGISDGGTGTYFFAFRQPTPFAAFLPLNGQMLVLANPESEPDGDMFPGNAVNKPFFAVNGGRDPLYPAAEVQPYVEHLKQLGTELVFHVQPNAGHETSWWPDERAAYEAFVAAHPRNPLPDKISWETERTDRYNRFDWLVIDRLGPVAGETQFADNNHIETNGRKHLIFDAPSQSGRVDLVRHGNTVDAQTEGVKAFTLLLSPAQFDLSKPVTVNVNGRPAFQGPVTPSLKTLLEWAVRDDDRTALYGAAVSIEVGK